MTQQNHADEPAPADAPEPIEQPLEETAASAIDAAPNALDNARASGGAPAGNRNATRHGVYGFLALGRLPKGASYVRRLMGEFRSELERAVVEAHGEVSLSNAALITTVCRHEGRALLLSRYLALEGDALKTLERASLLEAIGRASDARDKAIEKLKLAQAERDDVDVAVRIVQATLSRQGGGLPSAITHHPEGA